MESRERRAGSEGTVGAAAGCLITALAAATGFGVWFHGAQPGLTGGFEGQTDLSLLYVELPGMLAGFPVISLLVWRLTRAVLSDRGTRAGRGVVAGVVVALTLTFMAWACAAWLEHRVAWVFAQVG